MEFTNPFGVKKCDRKLNQEELIRAIRFSIASELEAIQIYEEIRECVDCLKTKTILKEIIEDEKNHIGNFVHLLKELAPEDIEAYKEGCEEARELIQDI